ncbi:hypothetical protein B0H17DRAFT_914695 [Mycena rosella]|uniref:Uncharacterized protein n=1 Tax=Mycena rosella TaxID=1033263 RepID=A0AAD7H3C3_MYCRO|nr:hypothetical protein B0H17DRAFT_914695 [Mycena rosella]
MERSGFSLDLQRRIYEGLLSAHVPETRESYGAGLLRFHQFCDREAVDELARMPADRFLLAAFVADAIGTCSGKCVRNWLNGLRNTTPTHPSYQTVSQVIYIILSKQIIYITWRSFSPSRNPPAKRSPTLLFRQLRNGRRIFCIRRPFRSCRNNKIRPQFRRLRNCGLNI